MSDENLTVVDDCGRDEAAGEAAEVGSSVEPATGDTRRTRSEPHMEVVEVSWCGGFLGRHPLRGGIRRLTARCLAVFHTPLSATLTTSRSPAPPSTTLSCS